MLATYLSISLEQENIDLKILASEAQRAALEYKTVQDLRSNPQVAVLVRKPCIAVKYPIDNGTVCIKREK